MTRCPHCGSEDFRVHEEVHTYSEYPARVGPDGTILIDVARQIEGNTDGTQYTGIYELYCIACFGFWPVPDGVKVEEDQEAWE